MCAEDAGGADRQGRDVLAALQPVGSGSDYTAFLDNLGVPSFDFGFGGPYGV
jgi:hypothetical protein